MTELLVIAAALAATIIAYSAYDHLFLPQCTAPAVVVWKRHTPASYDAAGTYFHQAHVQAYAEWVDTPEMWHVCVRTFNEEEHVLSVDRATYSLLEEGGDAAFFYGLGRLSDRVFPFGIASTVRAATDNP